MLNNVLLTIVSAGLLAGCVGSKSASPSAEGLSNEDVIGTWETETVEVDLHSRPIGKADSSFVIFPGPSAQGSSGQQPVTYINADGRYRDEVKGPDGRVLKSNSGFWHLGRDTLYLRMESQGDNETRFGVRKRGKKLLLDNRVDWDGDGKKDDEMHIQLRRQQ